MTAATEFRMTQGKYVGTGTASAPYQAVRTGFRQKFVMIKPKDGMAVIHSAVGAGLASSKARCINNTPGSVLAADSLTFPSAYNQHANCFVVKANAADPENLNELGKEYYWWAVGDYLDTRCQIGEYVGNGGGSRDITLTAVGTETPKFVMVWKTTAGAVLPTDEARIMTNRSYAQPAAGLRAVGLVSAAEDLGTIEALAANKFTVGTKYNEDGVWYSYLALYPNSNAVAGYYIGAADPSAFMSLLGSGGEGGLGNIQQSKHLLLVKGINTRKPVMRTAAMGASTLDRALVLDDSQADFVTQHIKQLNHTPAGGIPTGWYSYGGTSPNTSVDLEFYNELVLKEDVSGWRNNIGTNGLVWPFIGFFNTVSAGDRQQVTEAVWEAISRACGFFNSAISALYQANGWPQAPSLYSFLPDARVLPRDMSYYSVNANQWKQLFLDVAGGASTWPGLGDVGTNRLLSMTFFYGSTALAAEAYNGNEGDAMLVPGSVIPGYTQPVDSYQSLINFTNKLPASVTQLGQLITCLRGIVPDYLAGEGYTGQQVKDWATGLLAHYIGICLGLKPEFGLSATNIMKSGSGLQYPASDGGVVIDPAEGWLNFPNCIMTNEQLAIAIASKYVSYVPVGI